MESPLIKTLIPSFGLLQLFLSYLLKMGGPLSFTSIFVQLAVLELISISYRFLSLVHVSF